MRSPLAARRAVALPDLFVDAIVRLPPWAEMEPPMRKVVAQGGGNLPVPPVDFKLGGNAANTALGLARLGMRTDLVAETDAMGHRLLGEAAAFGLRATHVRRGKAASATIALEFGGANLMLSHAGPLRDFGPRRLAAADWRAMEAADAVVVANWAQNRSGTALLKAVVPRLSRKGVFVYLDTADPRRRPDDFARLLGEPAAWRGLGAWAMNENELRAATSAGPGDDLEQAALGLSHRLGCRIDVHTDSFALSVDDGKATRVAWRPARARRLTGAGDAWNAGNVAGYVLGLPHARRLRLAHQVAKLYVTGPLGLPPAFGDLPAGLMRR